MRKFALSFFRLTGFDQGLSEDGRQMMPFALVWRLLVTTLTETQEPGVRLFACTGSARLVVARVGSSTWILIFLVAVC
jgi:hypothetical protein